MTLEKAVSEHHVGALVKIQAWRRDGCAIRLKQLFSHHLCAVANQVTLVRCKWSRALIQHVHMDPARPSGWNEPTLRVYLNVGLLCVSDFPANMEVVCSS